MKGCEAGGKPAPSRQLEVQQGGRIQVNALPAHRQVEMRSGSPARASAQADLLSPRNPLSLFYPDFRKVEIKCEQSLPVIDHHAVAFEI